MAKPGVDKKTEVTFRTMENLRASNAVFQDFIKAATNYQKACLKMSETGKQLADAIQRVAQSNMHPGDIGDGIMKLAELQRTVETKRDNIARAMQDDLINGLIKQTKTDETETAQFDSDYKKTRANTKQQIEKLEAQTKKAGKKGGETLKQAISALNAKVKEADQLKAEKLRSVLLLERKKYCNFLTNWGPVISGLADHHSEGIKFREQEQMWRNLAANTQQLPPDMEQLIQSQQERTFISIQSEETGGTGGYDYSYAAAYDDSAYDSSSYGQQSYGSYGQQQSYSQPSYYGSTQGVGSSFGKATATALYDFAGEQAEDLSFFAGDVITITTEDDGSGWLRGELNGANGIFPASYVQRN